MRTEAIVIGIVLLVLLSSVAFGTFSYAVTTTSTGAQPPTTKAHSPINAVQVMLLYTVVLLREHLHK